MAELKTKETDESVDKFLAGLDDEQKIKDSLVLRELMEGITDAPAKMWGSSIIGFGSRHLKYASGRELDWMIVGFSPRKANLTLYLTEGQDVYSDLLPELGKHKLGKGCLYINRLSDIDEKVLREIITKAVKSKD